MFQKNYFCWIKFHMVFFFCFVKNICFYRKIALNSSWLLLVTLSIMVYRIFQVIFLESVCQFPEYSPLENILSFISFEWNCNERLFSNRIAKQIYLEPKKHLVSTKVIGCIFPSISNGATPCCFTSVATDYCFLHEMVKIVFLTTDSLCYSSHQRFGQA